MTGDTSLPQRPMIKQALRRLWRDARTLQLGVSARHAVVVRDVTPGERAVLALLDGTRDVDAIVDDAAEVGLSRDDVLALLQTLNAGNALDDGASAHPHITETQRQHLEPDLLTASLMHPEPGAVTRLVKRRGDANVVVHGGSRVGATIAMLLAAAGVGTVTCIDNSRMRQADIAPGAVRELRNTSRGDAVTAAVDALNAQTRQGSAPPISKAKRAKQAVTPATTLAVVTSVGGFPRAETVAATRDRPHLFVDVCETTASVGPFVLPGSTPCLRCLHLARGDRDRGWPMIAAQLVSRPYGVEACDVTLATFAASLAAMHVLRWLDDAGDVASAGGIVEYDLVDNRLRRRSVPAHPACGCGAATEGQAVIALPDARSLSA